MSHRPAADRHRRRLEWQPSRARSRGTEAPCSLRRRWSSRSAAVTTTRARLAADSGAASHGVAGVRATTRPTAGTRACKGNPRSHGESDNGERHCAHDQQERLPQHFGTDDVLKLAIFHEPLMSSRFQVPLYPPAPPPSSVAAWLASGRGGARVVDAARDRRGGGRNGRDRRDAEVECGRAVQLAHLHPDEELVLGLEGGLAK